VRVTWIGIALLVVVVRGVAFGQYQPPSESLQIRAGRAATWDAGGTNVMELLGAPQATGGVVIDLDRTHMTADNAVVWLSASVGGQPDEQNVTIALLGHAQLQQPEVTRSGDRLIVSAKVRGKISLTADERIASNDSNSLLYQDALDLRNGGATTSSTTNATTTATSEPATQPATAPTTRRARTMPILFHGTFKSMTTSDGKLAVLFSNGVSLSRQEPSGAVLELQADRGVLFTTLTKLRDAQAMGQIAAIEQAIVAAYLEGDVRIAQASPAMNRPQQRMEANRVYYDFTTDRAFLTKAVIRTTDPKATLPIIIRAQTVRQLSQGEYQVKNTELTTSSFKVPSYSIRATSAYVREVDTGDPRYGSLTEFEADNVTMRMFNVPFFYWPVMGGEFTQRGGALRGIEIESSNRFGFGVRTEWGLLEALGYLPPPELDASVRADYFVERGPGAGLNIDYGGGFISDTNNKASNFHGSFDSYFVPSDHGVDDLGRHRRDLPPEETFRGRIRWQHQQFLPKDWQVQLQSGWVSDPNFLEEWFQGEFDNGPPLETSFYAKKQKDSEALTLLVSVQPNHIVTTTDMYQDVRTFGPRIAGQFTSTNDHPFEIERIPEIGYHRIGESFLDDKLTLFSDNTFSGNHFMTGKASLLQLGFVGPAPRRGRKAVLPGIPALGTTGTTDDTIYRADLRQEVDYPFAISQLHFMPYVSGRYTGYTDSPDQGQINRFFTSAGVRINTAFWKIDESAQSDFFDIHRVRHVVEPEVHLFTAAETKDREDVFIYDPDVDAINDVSAASVALRQRWQTKRGGAGNERSVVFFTLSVEATWFSNKPPDSVIPPGDFRGLFFPTLPETSIPRDLVNGEATWRVSDSTVILADAQWNMEKENLATASIGLAARRGDRLGYYVGTRYIEELGSAITTVAIQYQLTTKYSLSARESFDFGDRKSVYGSLGIVRKFDRFYIIINMYRDEVNDNSGISFALYPEGIGRGVGTDALQTVFGGGR
jgi:hypothetical protein